LAVGHRHAVAVKDADEAAPFFPTRSLLWATALWAAPPSGPAHRFVRAREQAENGHEPVVFHGPAQYP
jgi:hypothetical protein